MLFVKPPGERLWIDRQSCRSHNPLPFRVNRRRSAWKTQSRGRSAASCETTAIDGGNPLGSQRPTDNVREILRSAEQSVLTVAMAASHDRRWIRCKRPFIVSGGELSLDMLDLRFNTSSRIYEAPFQLKANNGIYLVDDFGRQKAAPAEVLNRWIVPMERRVDYELLTGGKMTVTSRRSWCSPPT